MNQVFFPLCLQIFVCLTSFPGAVYRKPSDRGPCFEPPQSFHAFLLNTTGEGKRREGRGAGAGVGGGGILEYRGITICRRETICIELKKWHFMSRKWASAWNSQWHHSWSGVAAFGSEMERAFMKWNDWTGVLHAHPIYKGHAKVWLTLAFMKTDFTWCLFMQQQHIRATGCWTHLAEASN